jgi:hypothetical protein
MSYNRDNILLSFGRKPAGCQVGKQIKRETGVFSSYG